MLISKQDPLEVAKELLKEINELRSASERDEPVQIGCHCTSTDAGEDPGGIRLCVWCRVKLFLECHVQ